MALALAALRTPTAAVTRWPKARAGRMVLDRWPGYGPIRRGGRSALHTICFRRPGLNAEVRSNEGQAGQGERRIWCYDCIMPVGCRLPDCSFRSPRRANSIWRPWPRHGDEDFWVSICKTQDVSDARKNHRIHHPLRRPGCFLFRACQPPASSPLFKVAHTCLIATIPSGTAVADQTSTSHFAAVRRLCKSDCSRSVASYPRTPAIELCPGPRDHEIGWR